MIKKQDAVEGKVVVTFLFDATGHELPICIAGDFTGWDERPEMLEPLDGDYVAVSVALPMGGSYEFRYRDADGRWFNDDQADDYKSNIWGGVNGVVRT